MSTVTSVMDDANVIDENYNFGLVSVLEKPKEEMEVWIETESDRRNGYLELYKIAIKFRPTIPILSSFKIRVLL